MPLQGSGRLRQEFPAQLDSAESEKTTKAACIKLSTVEGQYPWLFSDLCTNAGAHMIIFIYMNVHVYTYTHPYTYIHKYPKHDRTFARILIYFQESPGGCAYTWICITKHRLNHYLFKDIFLFQTEHFLTPSCPHTVVFPFDMSMSYVNTV